MSDSVPSHRQQPSRLLWPRILQAKILEWVAISFSNLIIKSCLTLWNRMDHSPPGPSVYGISQARVLEWGAVSFSSIDTQYVPVSFYRAQLEQLLFLQYLQCYNSSHLKFHFLWFLEPWPLLVKEGPSHHRHHLLVIKIILFWKQWFIIFKKGFP